MPKNNLANAVDDVIRSLIKSVLDSSAHAMSDTEKRATTACGDAKYSAVKVALNQDLQASLAERRRGLMSVLATNVQLVLGELAENDDFFRPWIQQEELGHAVSDSPDEVRELEAPPVDDTEPAQKNGKAGVLKAGPLFSYLRHRAFREEKKSRGACSWLHEPTGLRLQTPRFAHHNDDVPKGTLKSIFRRVEEILVQHDEYVELHVVGSKVVEAPRAGRALSTSPTGIKCVQGKTHADHQKTKHPVAGVTGSCPGR